MPNFKKALALPAIALLWTGCGMAAPAAEAPASSVAIPGGALDMALMDRADVFTSTPQAATATGACLIGDEYVKRINAGRYAEVADLFAENGMMLEPIRKAPARGREEIRKFYQTVIAPMKPNVIPVSYVGEGRDCVMTLATRYQIDGKDRYVLTSVDHFVLDDEGKALSMLVYARPVAHAQLSGPSMEK